MENKPEYRPPRKRPKVIAFLIAGLGLFLLDGAVGLWALHRAGMLVWMLGIAGAALLILAVFWGKGRV